MEILTLFSNFTNITRYIELICGYNISVASSNICSW